MKGFIVSDENYTQVLNNNNLVDFWETPITALTIVEISDEGDVLDVRPYR